MSYTRHRICAFSDGDYTPGRTCHRANCGLDLKQRKIDTIAGGFAFTELAFTPVMSTYIRRYGRIYGGESRL